MINYSQNIAYSYRILSNRLFGQREDANERRIERRIADVKSPIGERGNKRYSPTWKAMRCRNSGSTPSRDRLDTSWYPSFWRNWSCISSGFSSEANLLPDSPPY